MLLGCLVVQAQTIFPVQSTTRILPPYSVYLADYAVNGNDKLQCILVNRDATQQTYQVRLRLTVTLNGTVIMRTNYAYNPAPITLTPGVAQIFAGATLEPYLKSENLDFVGYSQEMYEANRALPEGFYEIGFAAYDYYRQDVQVSNDGWGFYFLAKNEPPLINMPSCGSKIQVQYSTPIRFSWLPRNTASLNSSNTTIYRYFLYEVNPQGTNPNDIVNSLPPIYVDSTAINQTFYDLMPTTTLLRDSFVYAWRVQAVDINGADLFRNNGFSEVCTFTWGGPGSNPYGSIDSVLNLNAIGETERKGRMWWTKDLTKFDGYKVYYKKTGNGNSWFTTETESDTLRVFDLEPDTEYECRIQGRKNGNFGMYSDVRYFRTKKIVPVDCTNMTEVPITTTGRPMINLLRNSVITYRDFPIRVTDSIVVLSTPGHFAGKGEVTVPFLAGLVFAVKFNDIYIDDAGVVSQGEVQFVSKDVLEWWEGERDDQEGGNEVGDVVTGNDATDYTAPYNIAGPGSIQPVVPIVNGVTNIIITRPDGTKDTLKNVTLPTTIKDSDGEIYSVDSNGNVSTIGHSGGLPGMDNTTLNKPQLDKIKVIFKPHPDQLYAFDEWQDMYAGKNLVEREFEKLRDSANNIEYRVPNKAIASAKTDKIIARVEISDPAYKADSVKFVTKTGTVYPKVKTSTVSSTVIEYELTILGGPEGDAQELYAVYPKAGGGYITLGKLKISSYEFVVEKLVLIPVDVNENDYDTEKIREKLKKVYGSVNIRWDVRVDTALRSNDKWDIVKDGNLDVEGSGILADFASETREMKELKNQYKMRRPVTKAETYIFLLHKSNENGVDGGMPRGKRFGYIFIDEFNGDKQKMARTIAHEIGHGRYVLKHTFNETIGLQAGATKNIMDYRTGNTDDDVLFKYQWDQLFDPGTAGLLEGDDENQSHVVKLEALINWLKSIKGTKAQFDKSEYFVADFHYMYMSEATINGRKMSLYVEVDEDGEIDFSLGGGVFPGLDIAVKIPEMGDGLNLGPTDNIHGAGSSYHTAFYLGFNYTGTSKSAVRFFTESYEEFKYLMSVLGLSLTDNSKQKIKTLYNQAFTLAGDDCNKIDVIYENIPEFVIADIEDTKLLKDLRILVSCEMSHNAISDNGTNEEKGALNILKGIKDKRWLYQQLYQDKDFLEDLYFRLDGDYATEFWSIIADMAGIYDVAYKAQIKNFIHIGNAGDEYKGHIAHGYPYILDVNGPSGQAGWTCYIGRANIAPWNWGTYEMRKHIKSFTVTHPLQPIRVHFEAEDNSRILPAVFAYLLATRSNRSTQYAAWIASLNYFAYGTSIKIIFTKGTPKLLRALALIDLSKGVVDQALTNQNLRTQLSNTDAGQWFLDKWPAISIATDVLTIGGDLIYGLAKNGRTVSDAMRLNGETSAASHIDDITRVAEDAVGAVTTELVTRIRSRVQSSTGYVMHYSDAQLTDLITRGKNLGLLDMEVEDIIFHGCGNLNPVSVPNMIVRLSNYQILKSRGYTLIEEFDDIIFFRDPTNRAGKLTNKNDLNTITWHNPPTNGATWQNFQINCTDYLRFKFGPLVTEQLKVKIFHANGQTVDCFFDNVTETTLGKFIITDAKHTQKSSIVNGIDPHYTANQTLGYQWIADKQVTRIQVIGYKGQANGINYGDDLLPNLEGNVRVLTNDANMKIVEMSILRTQ